MPMKEGYKQTYPNAEASALTEAGRPTGKSPASPQFLKAAAAGAPGGKSHNSSRKKSKMSY